MKRKWIAHKFGGTSVANAERYRVAAEIVLSHAADERVAVVVSAMSGVTNGLIQSVGLAASRDDSYLNKLQELETRHLETIDQLSLTTAQTAALRETIVSDFKAIEEVLRGVWITRLPSERIVEFVAGHGELWSAQLLHAYLEARGHSSSWLDARKVLIVEPDSNTVAIDWQLSHEKTDAWAADRADTDFVVITGYVAATHDGSSTTLKRNGSDLSASIFAALLGADSVIIWTDVDGVFSADPRRVPDAIVIPELSYQEAAELAYFGAKVIHPNTMAPAIANNITVWIKNSFKPEAPGTRISASSRSDQPIKGFAAVEDMALINVEGTGMIGVPGVAHKLFGALRAVGVSIVMISQASSEHSICFAVPQGHAELAKKTIEQTFFAELQRGEIQTVDLRESCCIVAMVGEGMIERLGMAGQFFSALGKAGVNVRAIAQGSSERNISAVIEQHEATKALRALHSAFYLSSQTLSIGVIGTGLIGGTFLDQLTTRIQELRTRRGIDLRVRGIMNSRKMILHEGQLLLEGWRDELSNSAVEANLEQFVNHVHADHLPHAVIIDATASADLTKHYESWVSRGINIITPNKQSNAGPLASYRSLREAARKHQRYFLYETNVGAGLPIIHTLRDLIETGDQIIKIEGVLSGTLSYILNSFDGSRTFSEIVREAHGLGLTEPDPRLDLSGVDVARKLIILGREMGLQVEIEAVEVESMVPEDLRSASLEEYLDTLGKHDTAIADRLESARAKDQVLRYVGVINSDGSMSAGLRTYSQEHPFASLKGSDNIVSFQTARYNTQPMIVRGPGAGPEVTAAGVFADLLRLASFLGAPQ
ncbi:MAG TPA: bifunctional aspartate kinase/homoserine dehydrogenase I [Pyrinomonadaceae bacterium]|jgi:aspartokinase/homoserine dehydrogenase 1|nr:bifunctional aspartate kinase/homoserine dehydrogenase I [Pyrinomonadaceae bacterium]